MASSSYLNKEFEKKSVFVFLYRSYDAEGRQVFAYFSMKPARLKDFAKVLGKGGYFDLNEYGKVLYDGYGEPTQQAIDYIMENYKIDVSNCMEIPANE